MLVPKKSYLVRLRIERLLGMDSKELELYSTYEGQQSFIFKLGMLAILMVKFWASSVCFQRGKGHAKLGSELTKTFESPYLKAQTRY